MVKMALRQICRRLLTKTQTTIHHERPLHTTGIQCLFSSDMLGLEDYKRHRSSTQEKIGDLQDLFRKRMNEYMESSHNTIFTGDLKNMIYAATNEEDLETTKLMIERFRQQRGELRFSNFVFGPLIMRMCHLLNQPDLAYDLVMNESATDGFFDQMSTFTVLMDLLYENGRYQDVINVMEHVMERRPAGLKYPADCTVLYTAACCKLNTAEVYQDLLTELRNIQDMGNHLSLRTIIFSSLLAIQQNDPSTALDIIGHVVDIKNKKYPIPISNLKVLALTMLGREEDAILDLQCLLNSDGPDSRVYDIFPDVLNKLTESVEKRGDPELVHKVTELQRGLEENRHMHVKPLEEYVFSPIFRKRQQQDSYKARRRSGAMGYHNGRGRNQGLLRQEDK